MLSLCPFDISAGVGAFVIKLSQISSFFLISAKKATIVSSATLLKLVRTPLSFLLRCHLKIILFSLPITSDERRA